MTEILTGKEGLRAALENPDEWEVEGGQGHWMRYDNWKHLDLIAIDTRRFRRIRKPREPLSIWFVATIDGDDRGPFVAFEHPDYPELSKGTKVSVTITELVDGGVVEPDWRARCEQAEKELGELRNSFEKRADELQRVKTRHGENLGRLTEEIETMQGELEND